MLEAAQHVGDRADPGLRPPACGVSLRGPQPASPGTRICTTEQPGASPGNSAPPGASVFSSVKRERCDYSSQRATVGVKCVHSREVLSRAAGTQGTLDTGRRTPTSPAPSCSPQHTPIPASSLMPEHFHPFPSCSLLLFIKKKTTPGKKHSSRSRNTVGCFIHE